MWGLFIFTYFFKVQSHKLTNLQILQVLYTGFRCRGAVFERLKHFTGNERSLTWHFIHIASLYPGVQ